MYYIQKNIRSLICFSIFILITFFQKSSFAQIANLPYTETFSTNFILGIDLDFIPNKWFGNEISVNERIFQTENKELGMIATSSFTPEVLARLNLTNYNNVALTFKAKSQPNQEGNKSSTLYVSTSTNLGNDWFTQRAIQVFENQTTDFKEYKYNLPGSASGNKEVQVRFLLVKEDGDGKSPIVIIDDVKFFEESSDNIPPNVDSVFISTSTRIQIQFNDKVNSSATVLSNYQGLPNLSSATLSPNGTSVTLNFSADFGIGIERTLTVSNIVDKAGNAMSKPYVKKVIYNNLRPNIVITELMYNSPAEDDSLEFIELYNKGTSIAILGGLTFSKGITMTLPQYNLEAGEYLLLASNAKAAKNFFGKDFLQWESGALNNGGETIEIKNDLDQVVTSLKYERTWGGDGNGPSISFCSTVSEPNIGNYWISSQKATDKKIAGVEIFASPGEGCADNIIPEIRFTSYNTYAFEGAKFIKMQIQLVYPNTSTSKATLSLDKSSTATLGSDYKAVNSITFPYQLSFPADKNLIEIEIQILDDLQKEGIEFVLFNLSDPVNAKIGGIGNYRIDILDNDASITKVCINELSASNNSQSGIKDNYGNADDWIEIKNGGSDPIILAGYFITDDPKNLTKYQLPIKDIDSLTIVPNGYLILWADNETYQGVAHLPFALSSAGEYFALVMPDGKTIVDDVTFPAMLTNTSYGRQKDCDESWTVFTTPTFKASNQPTAIINRKNASSIILYPNPNSGTILYISEPLNYQIFDQMGRQLLRKVNSQQIDISSLSSGMYYLVTDEGLSTSFIISR